MTSEKIKISSVIASHFLFENIPKSYRGIKCVIFLKGIKWNHQFQFNQNSNVVWSCLVTWLINILIWTLLGSYFPREGVISQFETSNFAINRKLHFIIFLFYHWIITNAHEIMLNYLARNSNWMFTHWNK